MIEVRSPDGRVWESFVEWEGRNMRRRAFRRLRDQREARARKKAENHDLGVFDGCDALSVFGDGPAAAIFVVVAAVALLIVVGPWIGPFLLGIIELALLLVVIVGAFVGRSVFRRPWRVVAVTASGELWAWRQVGWFAARELARGIGDELAAGTNPADILPDRLEPDVPHQIDLDAPLGPIANPAYRHLFAGLAVLGVAIMAFVIAARLA